MQTRCSKYQAVKSIEIEATKRENMSSQMIENIRKLPSKAVGT